MKKNNWLLFLWAVFITLTACSKPGSELQSVLGPVCTGNAYSKATPYQGQGPHPIFYATYEGSWHPLNSRTKDTWLPARAEDAQLVLCISPESTRSIEVCQFWGGESITRYRYIVDVKLVEAQSGHIIAEEHFEGQSPRFCLSQERSDLTALYGSHVYDEWIWAWSHAYVTQEAK